MALLSASRYSVSVSFRTSKQNKCLYPWKPGVCKYFGTESSSSWRFAPPGKYSVLIFFYFFFIIILSYNIPPIAGGLKPVNLFMLVPYGPTLIKNPGRSQDTWIEAQRQLFTGAPGLNRNNPAICPETSLGSEKISDPQPSMRIKRPGLGQSSCKLWNLKWDIKHPYRWSACDQLGLVTSWI